MTFTHHNFLGDIELEKKKHQVVDSIKSRMETGFLLLLLSLLSITAKFLLNGESELEKRKQQNYEEGNRTWYRFS